MIVSSYTQPQFINAIDSLDQPGNLSLSTEYENNAQPRTQGPCCSSPASRAGKSMWAFCLRMTERWPDIVGFLRSRTASAWLPQRRKVFWYLPGDRATSGYPHSPAVWTERRAVKLEASFVFTANIPNISHWFIACLFTNHAVAVLCLNKARQIFRHAWAAEIPRHLAQEL